MEFRFVLLAALFIIFIAISSSEASYHKKKIIIHLPVEKSHHEHTHTQVKNIHHHHKPPYVIKAEKVMKKLTRKPVPIKIKEEISHDHYHHHYKHTHPEEIVSEPKPTSDHWLSAASTDGWDSGDRYGDSGSNNFAGSSLSDSFSNSFGSYGSESSQGGSSSGHIYANTNYRGGRKVASAAEAAKLSEEFY